MKMKSLLNGLLMVTSVGAGAAGCQRNTDTGSQCTATERTKADVAKTIKSTLPCDIYEEDGSPCVAAHSTVRLLRTGYSGPLYQVRGADGTSTKDIGFDKATGFANAADQDSFCTGQACTISKIYDQSTQANDLIKRPLGGNNKKESKEAKANALPVTLNGHSVYGLKNPAGVGYRNNTAKGTAEGDNAQTVYMVVQSDYFNGACCFDYGNAERNNNDNGEGTMEAAYYGSCTIWGKGDGEGPWVMGDLENGLWAGDSSPYKANASVDTNAWKYVTAMVKGDVACSNRWAIKKGNAQSKDALTKAFDGPRPSDRYFPMKKEGAIILGIGGDASNGGQGNFFEGVMTAHFSSDAADNAVQANIASVYGGTGAGDGGSGGGGTGGSGSGGQGGSGSGGASGGSSGGSSGGASGGSSGGSSGGAAVTSLSGSKTLGSLSSADAKQLCDDLNSYFSKTITKDTACKWRALISAASSSSPSETALKSFCSSKLTSCDGLAKQACGDLPSGCGVTVEQYSACIVDEAADFNKQVVTFPTCDSLTMANMGKASDAQSADLPASCTKLMEVSKCSSLSPPTLFSL